MKMLGLLSDGFVNVPFFVTYIVWCRLTKRPYTGS